MSSDTARIYQDTTYRARDVRRDAAMPTGYAPEDAMPDEIRRTERLRTREVGYRLAESLITSGVSPEVAALFIAVPHHVSQQRQWALRVADAELCGDTRRCCMPVRGCRRHGDTLEWRAGEWRCRVPKCRGFQYPNDQRRHCDQRAVAVIDYPSGHRRRVCAGHLVSEQAVWVDTPADAATIRVTEVAAPIAVGSAEKVGDAAGAGRPRLTVVDGGR
jgi:hypothetical protein